MRILAGASLLMPIALAFAAGPSLPKLDSQADLEAFFFPKAEEAIFDSMKAVFRLDNPGVLVTAAANAGPEYATRVAASIDSPDFRRQYSLLAKYLDWFGPCQRQQKPDTAGWWSAYSVYPGDSYCAEATKLVFAATLWSQVHYCQQLSTGEARPKIGPMPSHGAPYRLDETPVKTYWLIAEAVYAVADAAAASGFQNVLRKRALTDAVQPAEREAILDAANELDQKTVNRERTGLLLLKMMVRNYEAVHLRHIGRIREERQSVAPK